MKRLILFCCSICFLCSCSKNEILTANKISLGIKTSEYISRASIDSVADLALMGDRIGIYGVTDWVEPPVMNNVRTTSVNPQTGAINWNGLYYYPLNTNLRFYSYYPFIPVGTDGENYMEEREGAAPLLHFTITGQEDLMYAQPVTGSNDITPRPFVYEHLLTQFHFILIDEGDFYGTKIQNIIFKRVNTSSTLDIGTGLLGEWTNLTSVPFSAAKYPITITGREDKPQIVGGEVMLQPGLNRFYIDIDTEQKGVYYNIRITPSEELTFAAGRSYEITLRFNKHSGVEADAIKVSSQVTPWENGGDGNGDIGE